MSKSDNFTEFLCGAKRITECEGNRLKEEKNVLKTISSIKNKTKNVFLMPSDKTKRLIALDSDYYHDILKLSLCKDDVKLRNTCLLYTSPSPRD